MRLSTISSQFVFNLPSTLLPTEVLNGYNDILEKNWIQYSVLDYINSTVKSITFPGLGIDTPVQTRIRGKQIHYKPVKNVNDILTSMDLDITFRSVDSDLNYMLLWDIMMKRYMYVSDNDRPSNIDGHYIDPFTLKILDIHRDVIYTVTFRELIFKNLEGNKFDYSEQAYSNKEFTASFTYNWIDIDYNITKSKILDLSGDHAVIQKIGPVGGGYYINPFGR